MNRIGSALLRRVNPYRAWSLGLFAALALCVAPTPAHAQEDPPARVGRIADIGGEVFHAPEDRASDWATIGLNFPVTTGDNLWVAEGGRAEIDVGVGQIRLGGATNVHVSRIDDRTVAFFVAQGRAILRLRALDPGEVARIDTPNTQVVLSRPGLYRVDVLPDRQRTVLVVREGEAMLPSQGGMQQVLPGQTALAEGLDATNVDVRNGIATDGFDTWSANRDRRYDRVRSSSYVSSQMIGSADLDEFGRWENDTQFGAVWFPTTVSAGWAPFRDGYWTWMTPWGWTWVDAAPWGFAPSHYGRWAFIGGRWGWCPGGFVARPFWSPAMVGWVGGAGWGLSLSFGAPVYGWVPLAWGEPFRPWWNNCSYRCWTHFNRPYAVRTDERTWRNPPTRFENVNHPGGITAVPGAAFTGSRPVSRNIVPVNPNQVAGMPLLASAPSVERPGAGHIPMVKPGTSNTPRPASAYVPPGRGGYATSKPLESGGPAQRAMIPAPLTPSSAQRPATSVPGAVKPGSSPSAREGAVAPSSSTGSTLSAPGSKPAPSGSSPTLRGGTPAYTAPVQRDTLQTYPQGSQRGAASTTERRAAPSSSPSLQAGGSQAPVARPAPQAPVARPAPHAPPTVQPAPAPPPAVRPAPQPSSGGNGKPHGDGNRGAQQDKGGGGGGQQQGGGDKPGR